MNKVLLEYVWLDGYKTPNLRSKIKVINVYKDAHKNSLNPTGGWDGVAPDWNFDGSSTRQAPGDNSERILKPVRY